jgi:hypothetical protein
MRGIRAVPVDMRQQSIVRRYVVHAPVTPLYRQPDPRSHWHNVLLTKGRIVEGQRHGRWVQVTRGRWSCYIPLCNLREVASMPYSENSPIMAVPTIKPNLCVQYLTGHPHANYTDQEIADVFVATYVPLCQAVGLDWVLVIAQMIVETGTLTSFWSARPQRNLAGIGVTGRHAQDRPPHEPNWAYNTQRNRWEEGICFAAIRWDAIPAHVGRVLAYATMQQERNLTQHSAVVKALQYRSLPIAFHGTAQILKALGKAHNPQGHAGAGWAVPGDTYGRQIAAVANAICAV